jgi:hypothetical protein
VYLFQIYTVNLHAGDRDGIRNAENSFHIDRADPYYYPEAADSVTHVTATRFCPVPPHPQNR